MAVAMTGRSKYLPLSHTRPYESFLRLCVGQREVYDVWMQETTQRIIKLLGLLLPDLLVKKCSYQTSLAELDFFLLTTGPEEV